MQPKINQSADTISERVEFLCDKSLFKGKVYRPPDLKNCKGIVVFTHGLGYCDRQYKIDGEDFARKKYLMLTYNLRGHAGTPGKWTLQNSVEDLIEGINFLVHRYQFPNKDRICVIGHSTGALITLLASLRDKRIKFGSVVTTVTCLKDSFLYWFESGFNHQVKEFFKTKGVIPPAIERFMDDKKLFDLLAEGKIPREELEIPHRYGMLKSDSWYDFTYEIVHSVNIIDHASELAIPLLLFRGERDEVMDVQKTNELYENLDRKLPSKLYITGSHNHFHNDKWDLIQTETLKFFDEFCTYHLPKENILEKDILVIDDEELVTQTLRNLLKKNGFSNVITVNRAEGAFQEIARLKAQRNKDFDMIIADIRLPGLDGIAAVKRIKELITQSNGRQSQVIFITGYEGGRTQEEAKEVGYVDYLFKPFDMEDFLTSVRKHLK
ncbi:MAG: alpha/beta fold hydrolase [Planctomycetes bacterium]|nr:alpha/beta fold hydrolase [Planctomycetota bacterium]